MLVLNRSLLNREYILANVLKVLASIFSLCNLQVTFLSKITPRYFTLRIYKWHVSSIQCKMGLRWSTTARKLHVNPLSLIFIYCNIPALTPVSIELRPCWNFLTTTDRTENTVSNHSSIVFIDGYLEIARILLICLFISAGRCLSSSYLVTTDIHRVTAQ
jgi:hypothetical protein